MRGLRGSRNPSGSAWAAEPHSPSSNSKPFGMLATVVAFADLVLAAPVGLATAGRVALAHLGFSSFRSGD